MRKFTLTIVAALMAVVSFAQRPTAQDFGLKNGKGALIEQSAFENSTDDVNPLLGKKSPKVINTLDDLPGTYVYYGRQPFTNQPYGGGSMTITLSDDKVIFNDLFEEGSAVEAVVGADGSFTISNQDVYTHETYGAFEIATYSISAGSVVINRETPISGTIYQDGIVISSPWGFFLKEGEYAGEFWDLFSGNTILFPANAKMDYTTATNSGTSNVSVPVFVTYDVYEEGAENPNDSIEIYNFAGNGLIVGAKLFADKTFRIVSQTSSYGGSTYGTYSTYSSDAEANESKDPITGTGDENALTFGTYWMQLSTTNYWRGLHSNTTLSYTDGSKFKFPVDAAGINATTVAKEVASESYVDLSGRKVSADAKGLVLKTVTYADGTKKTVKVVR